MGYTLKDIANNLNIDISTVWRLIKLFETTGNVSKRLYPKGQCFFQGLSHPKIFNSPIKKAFY